jgi:hypothetical protein
MANFTVYFADRYFKWLDADEAGTTRPQVWKDAFDYGRSGKSSVTEDLYLGMSMLQIIFLICSRFTY